MVTILPCVLGIRVVLLIPRGIHAACWNLWCLHSVWGSGAFECRSVTAFYGKAREARDVGQKYMRTPWWQSSSPLHVCHCCNSNSDKLAEADNSTFWWPTLLLAQKQRWHRQNYATQGNLWSSVNRHVWCMTMSWKIQMYANFGHISHATYQKCDMYRNGPPSTISWVRCCLFYKCWQLILFH